MAMDVDERLLSHSEKRHARGPVDHRLIADQLEFGPAPGSLPKSVKECVQRCDEPAGIHSRRVIEERKRSDLLADQARGIVDFLDQAFVFAVLLGLAEPGNAKLKGK